MASRSSLLNESFLAEPLPLLLLVLETLELPLLPTLLLELRSTGPDSSLSLPELERPEPLPGRLPDCRLPLPLLLPPRDFWLP